MSRIYLINNQLDESESEIIESENILFDFLNIRKTHPQARIYSSNPCPENDITPNLNDVESIEKLKTLGECTIVCFAGKSALKWVMPTHWLGMEAVDYALSFFMPKIPGMGGEQPSGSSNNNLSNPENRQRIKGRPPYIIGRVKSIPDLLAPPYRYFEDGVEVEELLLCVSENKVQLSEFKEGDTPVSEISGKSLSAYDLNKNIIGNETMYKIGDSFTEAPLIVSQSNSVNGQTLITPNATMIDRGDIYFVYPNQIKVLSYTTDLEMFVTGDTLIIEGANYGIADLAITGNVNINRINKTLSITSNQTVSNYQDFRKINVTAMLITDPVNGQLDLAGLYDIQSITHASGIYTIALKNAENTNTNFANLTANASTNISANLTANTESIFLDGTYTVTGVDIANHAITLATPATVNSDWLKLDTLNGKQTPTGRIKLRGSQENYIGWFTSDVKSATGLLFNFKAMGGIYQGWSAKTAVISVQYQQVVGGVGVGQIYEQSITLTGKANNRDAVGASLYIDLPFSGALRFRARRVNDNGDAQDLVDEVKFYQAYAYHRLAKLVHNNRVIVRQKTIATPSALAQQTRQLNCIAESLVYSYRDGLKSSNLVASRNIADQVIAMALHPKIGRMTVDEIDFDLIYQAVDDIEAYFGTSKMAEFNWTLDQTNLSIEEIMRKVSIATCSHDRRINRKIYFDLESADAEPIILFNHRNKMPKTETRGYNLLNKYDGVELTYIDSENGWTEKIVRVPNNQITNPKKVEGTGIVYTAQAHIVAWREWQKAKFSRQTTSFSAYCEADLVFRGDCVLDTNDTRIDNTSSGEIVSWSGLDIVGSQPFLVDVNSVIHLQLKSGAIDVIPISQGVNEYSFRLQRPPLESLITNGELKTLYSITQVSKSDAQRFIVTQKRPLDETFENEVSLIKWDARFYLHDKDFINNLI